jgi:transcriptional antiterminator RfaH
MKPPADLSAFSTADWYCAYTKLRQENFAALHLQRQGIEVFFPQIKARRKLKGDVQWGIAPMFPRYLFIRPSATDILARIRSTLGITSFVAFGGIPAHVPNEVIEIIKQHSPGGVCDLTASEFIPGCPVKIIAGPYAGMQAIFARETSQKERVIILLEIMASVAKVKIDHRHLKPLQKWE